MTQVRFDINVAQRLVYACRLLRKASVSGRRALVWAPQPVLTELDALLWTFVPSSFVPHCRLGAPDAVQARSPILLAEDCTDTAGCSVIVPLGWPEAVPDAGRFERVIEIVTSDEADRRQARHRWRQYQHAGYAPQSLDRSTTA
ncbi:MAG: DNA polymerase III subunit chi [Rhodoferax sp.]